MVKKSKRWSEKDLRDLGCGKHLEQETKKGRYGNVNKIEHDGITFDSKREFLRYQDLKILERAGEIRELKVHPKYPIIIADIPIRIYSKRYHKNGRQLTYEADFEYWRYDKPQGHGHLWKLVIEDVKMQSGFRTEVYKIKQGLMRAMGHTIEEY
jgi:hypothetical protein